MLQPLLLKLVRVHQPLLLKVVWVLVEFLHTLFKVVWLIQVHHPLLLKVVRVLVEVLHSLLKEGFPGEAQEMVAVS